MLINDETPIDIHTPVIDGVRVATGGVPRDYGVQPLAMRAIDFPVYSKQELVDRIKERKAKKMGLRQLRRAKKIPSLQQGQWGYCWSHSPTMALMMRRLSQNMPHVPLSAFMIAATIKNGRNQGGWAALAMEFLEKHGTCSQAKWAQGNADPRKFNDPAIREEAALYKVTDSWVDLDDTVYERNLTLQQVLSLLVNDVPVAADFYWWGHSVCLFDADVLDGEPCPVGINSWGDQWGDLGEFTLQGKRAIPNGAVAPRETLAV